jgi:hypothetical protein
MRTARSRTSGENWFDFLLMALSSQGKEPPQNPGRFTVQTFAVCWLIQVRTSPTFHAVTLKDNRCGFGNVPAFTLRQRVGALKGSGAGAPGLLGLCTNCDSRMNALSGRASNTDAGLTLKLLDPRGSAAVEDSVALVASDMVCRPLKLTFNCPQLVGRRHWREVAPISCQLRSSN